MSDNKIRTITKDGVTYDIEDGRVDGLPEQVNQNTEDISGLNGDIQNLEGRISTLEGRPVGNVMNYITDYSMDELPSAFIAQLNQGDTIYSSSSDATFMVGYKTDSVLDLLEVAAYDTLNRYNYSYRLADGEWVFDNVEELIAGGGGGGALYQHRISINAWDDTEPGGMGYDWIVFYILSSNSTPYTLTSFKQNFNSIPLEGATVFEYFSGPEDTSYHGGIITYAYLNPSTQNMTFEIDMYNYEGVRPKINASWTTLSDDVIQL